MTTETESIIDGKRAVLITSKFDPLIYEEFLNRIEPARLYILEKTQPIPKIMDIPDIIFYPAVHLLLDTIDIPLENNSLESEVLEGFAEISNGKYKKFPIISKNGYPKICNGVSILEYERDEIKDMFLNFIEPYKKI